MLKTIVKWLISFTPYRIVHKSINRFEAIEVTLKHLNALGYSPKVVIDGGAHLGWFSRLSANIFHEPVIYMIEPQPACQKALKAIASVSGLFNYIPYAISSYEGSARLTSSDKPSTGAFLSTNALGDDTIPVPVSTLDKLLISSIKKEYRSLLKLDLQGHELEALNGAKQLLPLIEVVIVEVSFYKLGRAPSISALISFFDKQGFDLFDIAGLASRNRDGRLRQGDFVLVRRDSPLLADTAWA